MKGQANYNEQMLYGLSVSHSVHEHKTRKSQEPLKRFSQNLVLYVFRARENDLDMSQSCKKSGCLSIREHNSHKFREPP